MSVFVLNCESAESTEVVGVYMNEKLAKAAAAEYVATWYEDGMKKKQVKKDSNDTRKVLFAENVKENAVVITMTETPFDMPKGKGSKKEKKDPLSPKKGLSSYMCYFKENREKIKSQNPDAEFGDIGRLIGAAWKSLDEDQKAVYEALSKKDKKRYENDMAKYEAGEELEAPKPKTAKKTAPKKTKEELDDDEDDEDEEEVVKPMKSKGKAAKA